MASIVMCLLGLERTALPLLLVLRFPCSNCWDLDLEEDDEATGGFMTLPCCCWWWSWCVPEVVLLAAAAR